LHLINKIKFFFGRKIRYLIFILRIPYFYYVDYILQFIKYSNWIKKNKHQLIANFSERNDLYIFLNKEIIKNKSIDYLEFGVADGFSFKKWLNLNKNPNSRFYGFDTFKGLPENYKNPLYDLKKGSFTQYGKKPKFKDRRYKLYKGLIQICLPIFLKKFKQQNFLVVNVDVDLYSAALFILCNLKSYIPKKNIFIFDEFATAIHEFRAFDDFVKSYQVKYKLIASSNDCYSRMAIKFIT
jgi:O-methyltransferase